MDGDSNPLSSLTLYDIRSSLLLGAQFLGAGPSGVARLLLRVLKLSRPDLLDPTCVQVRNHLVLVSLHLLKPLGEETDLFIKFLVTELTDALSRPVVEFEVDDPLILTYFLFLALLSLAVLSSPLLLFRAVLSLLFFTFRLKLELFALLVIALDVLDDVFQFFHLDRRFLLEALVAEVASGHVDAAPDVQVFHCNSFHSVLLLLATLLGQAILAVRVCVMSH